jgi:general secretion pathway protein C
MGYVEDIFHKATIEPCVQENQTCGLRITGLENTPVAGLFGLRNGDVVERINGQDLTNKQKAFQVLQKARNQRTIHIELRRNGKAKSLSFDL